ncbi:MAG: MopE-related protein [Myxococcota bacterium]
MGPRVVSARSASLLAVLLLTFGLAACSDSGGTEGGPDTTLEADGGDASSDVMDASDVEEVEETVDEDVPDPDPGEFGAPCSQNSDCYSGFCVPSAEGLVCSRTCTEDCPGGWSCIGVSTAGTDGAFICWPGGNRLCEPCVNDLQCDGGLCLTLGDGQACTRPCNDDGTCPEGYACELRESESDPGTESEQCVPVTGLCACTLLDEGKERPCRKDNDFGTCWGLEVCKGAAGWSTCDAQEPTAESCDGLDNDCDGLADEDVVAPMETCTVDNEFGSCAGTWTCGGADGWQCVGPTASEEVCNFLDDDCDGETDEGFVDPETGAYSADEHCGVCGNDCDGLFPHATSTCQVDEETGEAQCVVESCEEGWYAASPTTCLPLVDTSCLPCAEDANCVVPGAACVELGEGGACAIPCGEGNVFGTPEGECPAGYACETLTDGSQQCLPDSGSCTCIEEADTGKSRPCARSNEVGTCTGLQTCDATTGWSACSAVEPAAETCNGLDDECDGLVDEDLVEPVEACEVTNEFGTCTGEWQCEGESGWLCTAKTPAAETCNGQDDDCDGEIDEDFVDPDSGQLVNDEHCGVCGQSCDGAILFSDETTCQLEDGAAVCVALSCDVGYVTPPETNRVCIPEGGGIDCTPCTEDSQCSGIEGGVCEPIGTGMYCTRTCTVDDDCASAYSCVGGTCKPDSGSCTCLPSDDGAVRLCTSANEHGSCLGTQTCDPTQNPGWSACDAAEPAAEVCNGVDDDCNGVTDENVVHDPPGCEKSNEFGTCGGAFVCDGADGWSCSASLPEQETCNFADDDCDGMTDEDFRDPETGSYVADGHCGTCGNDCEGIPNAEGACVEDEAGPHCTVAQCDPGFFQVGPLTCVQAVDTLCAPCLTDDNCPTPGDACLEMDGGSFCGRACGADNPYGLSAGECPTGYTCQEVEGSGAQCVPTSGSCSCLGGDGGQVRSCVESNDAGICFGSETCDPAQGWVGCTAAVPAEEVCNEQDDDCNLAVDDVVGRGQACDITNEFGTCAGTLDCVADQEALACVGRTPAAETCNREDDDCDGEVDEDFTDLFAPCSVGEGACQRFGTRECTADGTGTRCSAEPGADTPEICDGVDNDCDGETDEDPQWADLGDPCFVGEGACQAVGVYVCDPDDPAAAPVCDATPGTGGAETCNGIDDDCDGSTDEAADLDAPLCDRQEGVCAGAAKACGGATGWVDCTGPEFGPDWQPSELTCDGLDNDCDGLTDETLPAQPCAEQDGVCAGSSKTCGGSEGFLACGAAEYGDTYEADETTCDGLDNDCDGVIDEAEGLSAPACTNQAGVCAGSVRSCGGSNGWLACGQAEFGADWESVEVTCDGLDNDCDGLTDEDLSPVPCDNQEGVCAGSFKACGGAEGHLACGAAEYGEDYEAEEATCDHLDNDCDGLTDEPFTQDGLYVSQDHCGSCGRSCTGAIPNGTAVCDASGGTARCVVASCADGYVKVGDDQCVPTDLGLCSPCVDAETCVVPGAVCAPLDDGSFCLPPCESEGTCPDGFSCSALDSGTYCVPDTNACTCDGSNTTLQRACEEEYVGTDGAAEYSCFGTEVCTATGWSECSLPEESCNLLDDDCDGEVDEGFVDEDGRYTSDEHCGACGNDCTLLEFNGGAGSCNTNVDPPVCSTSCSDNCFDVNANPSDGCECCDPQPDDLPDPDGVDANCDGIDGVEGNGIFVAKNGDDANDGSRYAPKRTIQAGIDAAVAQGKRDVYVATGVYGESVMLKAGVGVYGGYSADFLARDATLHEVAILAPAPTATRPGGVNAVDLTGDPGATVFDGFSVFGYEEKASGESSYAIYIRDSGATLRVSNNQIFGGSGGKGGRGDDGSDGSDGVEGQGGVDALDLLEAYGVEEHDCTAANHSPGGAGGVHSCGGVPTQGGAGGERTCPSFDGSVTGLPEASEQGVAGANGDASGGSAGRDVYHQSYSCDGYSTFGPVEGEDGADGTPGTSGTSGDGCLDTDGEVSGGMWTASSGAMGGAGGPGGGGGGGGSGGGAYVHTSCFSKDFGYDNLGGTGGGGGAGGCGGTGGTGGTGGGGAFGIFVVFTTMPASVPDLNNNALYGGTGGDGGAGGNAGTGGSGGAGALGGLEGGTFDPPEPSYPAFKGGKGGNGGNGGHGGGGGGGCGGPAYGIFAVGPGAADLTSWKTTNVFAAPGAGGDGGNGGFSLGLPGGDGLSGVAADTNF